MSSSKPPWYRSRSYLHFYLPVSFKKARNLVTNPELVSKHAFFPLINYAVESKKIKKDKKTHKIDMAVKERPIAYSAHIDSHIYAYYASLLSKKYEIQLKAAGLTDCILAFRGLGKSNIDFACEAFEQIKIMGECSAVALDFSKFFDTLDHSILKESWANLLVEAKLPADHFNVFKSITQFSQVNKIELYKEFSISLNNPKNGRKRVCSAKEFREVVREKKLIKTNKAPFGIPQGSPISALLSNIYMFEFDAEMKRYMDIHGGKYYRYCDDMLFIVPAPLRDSVAGFAQERVKQLKVSINTNKTELRTFTYQNGVLTADQMLQYLGFMFDGENVYIRSSSLARYSEKMKRGVRLAKKTMDKYNAVRTSKGLPEKGLYKRKLYSRYTHLGGRNFVTYGLRAANKMKSKTIKRQLKPLWRRFHEELDK
ncbi:antiviral reverse transcriptase Drt2 [Zobellella iuensis]|uniref:Group II intron reverse transcriptase domain-containing protein n=1 Tax=Zobellella iuensis TaxID=2803811 RepID=A0ABS1QSX8_9GAMM|nr:antiviral reverse transcriptase Drt2 [Zobellella iuensis]MBL1377642.1 group II intron reverse transcriptase domain-containing protein [Zobellella iuensis]